jgi:C4-dicarboxylate transporter, DctM subunit
MWAGRNKMETWLLVLLLVGMLFFFLALGVPVAFSMGLVCIGGILLFLSPAHLFRIAQISYSRGTEFLFIVVPLFILMANVISFAGVGGDAFTAAQNWLGRLPGGLAVSTIMACTGFAAVCGSSPATAATIGAVSVPEMLKRGYDKKLATGCVAAGGTLGILIPPSVALILYGIITETSIGALFIAGILPGICLSALLSLYVMVVSSVRPSLAPSVEGVSWSKRLASLKRVGPILALSVIVLGSIYTGVATPTESASLGATAAIVIAAVHRSLSWKNLKEALLATVRVTSMVLFLIFGGVSFAFVLAALGIPIELSEALLKMKANPWLIMVLINLAYLVLGCIMDPLGIMIITLPILFPAVVALGFDPVWFGIIVTINTEIGMITPPVGFNLFVLKSVVPREVSLTDIILGSLPFVLVLIAGLVLILLFPQIALWLPSRLGS